MSTRTLSASAIAATVVAGLMVTGSSAAAAPATGTCTTARTVCLWAQTGHQGERFTVQANNPTTGTCVSLAAHGWGDGRAVSARNTGNQVAWLYLTTDCTGTPYQLIPQGTYGTISFASNSMYVH